MFKTMVLKEKYINDLESLIQQGVDLQYGMINELKEEYKADFVKLSKEEKSLCEGKSFKNKYNAWYNESLMLVKQLMPDRVDDFIMQYRQPKRKEITFSTYTISDYLMDVEIHDAWDNISVGRKTGLIKIQQQYSIIVSLKHRFASSLYDIRQLVQADMMDSEIEAAKHLLKNGFLRAAGAICGVVLEKHLSNVCNKHGLKSKKKNPCVNDFNQLLKDEEVIDTAIWRYICMLGDIRNLCDHHKNEEPRQDQVSDLIIGTDKIIKTVF